MRTSRGICYVLVIAFVLPIIFLATASQAAADPGWWDTDWGYRVPITLTTHENVPENYQYRIVLDKVDNLGGHCLDNFQDIIFLEGEDSDLLSFWMENYINGDNAIFRVRRADNSLVDNTIYAYYGNTTAPLVENGFAVFELFDDFEDGDVTGWSLEANAVFSAETDEVSHGTYSARENTGSDYAQAYKSFTSTDDNIYIEWDVLIDTSSTFASLVFIEKTATDDQNCVYLRWYLGDIAYYDGSYHDIGTYALDTWYRMRILAKPQHDSFDIWIDGVSKGTDLGTRGTFDAVSTIAFTDVTTAPFYVDDVLVHKWVDPEPTASVGAEEEMNFTPITYNLDVGSTVDDDCVLYLNFDENSGQTENAVYDSSGENNYGTMENFNFNENSGWVVGRRDTALLFDGENDFVDCDNDSSLNFGAGSFSVEVWIRPANIVDAQFIVTKYNPTLDVGWFLAVQTGGDLYMDVYDGANDLPLFVDVPFTENTWYHVAFTYDTNVGSLYIDGVLENSGDGSSVGDINTTTNLLIGRQDRDDAPLTFDGRIDEVRIYDRALSAEEVENHYRKDWLALKDLTPKISWSYYDADGDDCENVQIQVGSTPGAGDMWLYYENSSCTFIDYAGSALTRGENYYVRARTHDGTTWGDSTANLQFRIAFIPPIPSPLYSTTFTWTENVAGENYDIQIDDDSGFGSLVIQDNNIADNTYTHNFTENGVYYWRVRAISIDNLRSAWSSVQTVWVNTPHTAPSILGVAGIAIALVAVALAAKRARSSQKH